MAKINCGDIPEEDLDLEEFKDSIDMPDDYEDFEQMMSYGETLQTSNDEKEAYLSDTENIEMLDKQQEFINHKNITNELETKINDKAKEIYPDKKNYRSLVLEYFPPELCIELEKLTRTFSIDNNSKMKEIQKLLKKWNVPFDSLGGGTNRYGIFIDGYAVKIAYDEDGMIDNKREFIYSLALQPYVIKTYECVETGLISVCEYVSAFTEEVFSKSKVQSRMR